MYSINEASIQTGVPEKKIRMYIAKELIADPLNNRDIALIRDIQWLRKNGVQDYDTIRSYITNPKWIPGNSETCYEEIREEMNDKVKITGEELIALIRTGIIAIAAIVGIFTFVILGLHGITFFLSVCCYCVTIFYALLAVDCYLEYSNPPTDSMVYSTGYVRKVISDRRFHMELLQNPKDYWWQIIMDICMQFRLDCWYPVIHVRGSNGQVVKGLLHYPSSKLAWNKGDNLEVKWNPAFPDDLYPADDDYLKKRLIRAILKTLAAFIMAILLTIVSGKFVW